VDDIDVCATTVPKSEDAFKSGWVGDDMQLTKKLTDESKGQLKDRHCVPCEGGVPALDEATSKLLLDEVSGWTLRGEGEQPGQPAQIGKRFQFADFLGAMAFVDKMAALAEREAHHPDFCVHYSRVDVTLWTHAARGLSENDFILASKLDAIVS
jgi:4a-hydroxytetrahydrobiopterin dehydratase